MKYDADQANEMLAKILNKQSQASLALPQVCGAQSGSDCATNERASAKDPLPVIRGSRLQRRFEVGIDWLRVSIPISKIKECRVALQKHFICYKKLKKGNWGYECKFQFSDSVSISFDRDPDLRDVHNNRATIEMPGGALRGLSIGEIQRLMHVFAFADCKPVRVDLCADDFSKAVTPETTKRAYDRGNVVGFRKCEVHDSVVSQKSQGLTVAYGGRGKQGSGLHYRIYDKNAESKGQINSIRWEVELTGKHADVVFHALRKSVCPAKLIGEYVAGAISFRDRSKDKNISRCPNLPWWEKIVKALGCAKIRLPKKQSTLKDKMDWVDYSVGKTLWMIRESFIETGSIGGFENYIDSVLRSAEDRVTDSDMQVLNNYLSNLDLSFNSEEIDFRMKEENQFKPVFKSHAQNRIHQVAVEMGI